jgi:hypothetical protein
VIRKFVKIAHFYFLALDLVVIPVYEVVLLNPAAETFEGPLVGDSGASELSESE